MIIEQVTERLENALPGAKVDLQSQDMRHFSLVVVAEQFEGKSMIEQHQMIYSALGDAMEEAVHALTIRTFTPLQWEKIHGV